MSDQLVSIEERACHDRAMNVHNLLTRLLRTTGRPHPRSGTGKRVAGESADDANRRRRRAPAYLREFELEGEVQDEDDRPMEDQVLPVVLLHHICISELL